MKEIFLHFFSQLMMKVLKVLGHPRRRGVPAKPPPPFLIHPWGEGGFLCVS